MTEQHGKSRQQAETAFAAAQSEFLAKRRVGTAPDPAHQAQMEKTARLKSARLAREAAAIALEHPQKA